MSLIREALSVGDIIDRVPLERTKVAAGTLDGATKDWSLEGYSSKALENESLVELAFG